jgi:DNA invertase Pin-like site-specific DNA recombinase
MTKKLRVAAYARVSTLKKSQDESPQHQWDAIREYFARRPDCEIVMWKSDRMSGGKGEEERPGLAEVMGAARDGKVDVIAVTKLSRMFRSVRKWNLATIELERCGTKIVFVNYPMLDPTTAQGRLMINLTAALDEFYRDSYGDAAIEGKARAHAAGKHCARPREVVPVEALILVDSWIEEDGACRWQRMTERLERSGHCQPARLIRTTGRMREKRAWNRGTLMTAYRAWVQAGRPGKDVVKTPPNAALRIGEKA